MFGERYVWIVLGDEAKAWWSRSDHSCSNSSCRASRKVNCSDGQVLEAASVHLYTGIAAHSDPQRKVISGEVSSVLKSLTEIGTGRLHACASFSLNPLDSNSWFRLLFELQ